MLDMKILESARNTIDMEMMALRAMSARLDGEFEQAISLIANMGGRLVVVGMGKSGIIGQKMAATFASTGTPSFFVHPGEAFHGDLGMIKPEDVALLISNSGETEEVIRILPFLQHQQNKIIALTGNTASSLARHADVVLDVGVEREACNINLAPTSSTTCTLVMGDALAVALTVERNFQPEDFARFHPGGSLGRKLLTRVVDVMHKDNLPVCRPDDSFRKVVQVISEGRLGLVLVMHETKLVGLITDGDIRRAFDRHEDCRPLNAADLMTRNPKSVEPQVRLVDAEQQMRDAKVGALVVQEAATGVVGVLQIYD
jgi:arabinose-5-phosphate isomerase